ncbi:hypothetical protein [Vibrio paucivorans]|uniref:Uncharacterized protein n=1 Tax=Vibrio paucivorans TaxID=2829489 RepID=A0A9X3CEA1_9VIBR|nr:hypothetical protein [Vibrio paucivorans]MCW8334232.1 hypothetical protein [Vibrio paucivorans]
MSIVSKSKETITTHKGKAHLWIKDSKGLVFKFDRVAHVVNGGVDLDQMRPDECLLAPGHIYRFNEELSNDELA